MGETLSIEVVAEEFRPPMMLMELIDPPTTSSRTVAPTHLAVCSGCGDPESTRGALRRINGRYPLSPILLFTDLGADEFRPFEPDGSCPFAIVSPEKTRASLMRVMKRAVVDGPFVRIAERIARNDDLPWLLRTALVRIWSQSIPSVEDAVEAMNVEQQLLCRSVDELARRIGCGASSLRRQSAGHGFRMSSMIRWSILLRGFAIYRVEGNWTHTAYRLGFSSISGWTHFVTRICGAPPRVVWDQGAAYWWTFFLEKACAARVVPFEYVRPYGWCHDLLSCTFPSYGSSDVH